MIRHSQEQRLERQQRQACSKSRNRRRRKARSQSRPKATDSTTNQKGSFIPVGYEDTRREELRQEAKCEKEQARKDKVQERQQRGAEKAVNPEEKLKDEVFYHQRDYVDLATRRLKTMKLPATDPHVRCLWIFRGDASSRTAQILAIFDWASKYFKLGGEYPVPKLPGWVTAFLNVTSMSRFPDGVPLLPIKRTAMNFPNAAIHLPGTWQWMADLLQYWSNVSNTKTQGGLSRTQSTLVEQLMEVINPHFPAVKERITWESVAFGSFHWLESCSAHTEKEKADYEHQLRRRENLNELELATQRLWQDWMQADEINKKRQQAKRVASCKLLPERRAAQLEREKQAKITGLQTTTQTEDRYPGWVAEVWKKPSADTPTPYQTPGDLRRGMTNDERNAALGAELGAEAVIDPLASPASRRPSPGPQTPPQFMDTDVDIPSIALPPASLVTRAEE